MTKAADTLLFTMHDAAYAVLLAAPWARLLLSSGCAEISSLYQTELGHLNVMQR